MNKVTGMFLVLTFCYSSAIGQEAESPINVMSFNIRYNNPEDGVNAWPNRKARVASMIEFHSVDLLGLQEVLKDQLENLAQALPGYEWVGVGRSDGLSGGEFAPILYKSQRFTLVESGTFWLSETPQSAGSKSWDAALPRIATWAMFTDKVTLENVFHLNTHFDHRGEIARVASAKLITNLLPSMASGAPIVVTGDFNKAPGSEVYQQMTATLNDSKSLSRIPAHGPEGTFGGFTVEIGETSERIDYVFLSSGIEVLRYGALSDQWNGYYPSDHLPVFAEIILPR